jgi:hypothetical protein
LPDLASALWLPYKEISAVSIENNYIHLFFSQKTQISTRAAKTLEEKERGGHSGKTIEQRNPSTKEQIKIEEMVHIYQGNDMSGEKHIA